MNYMCKDNISIRTCKMNVIRSERDIKINVYFKGVISQNREVLEHTLMPVCPKLSWSKTRQETNVSVQELGTCMKVLSLAYSFLWGIVCHTPYNMCLSLSYAQFWPQFTVVYSWHKVLVSKPQTRQSHGWLIRSYGMGVLVGYTRHSAWLKA